MRRFQSKTLIVGLIGLAITTAACSGTSATATVPDDQPDQTTKEVVALSAPDPDDPGQSFGAYIPGQGLFGGSDISNIPGYEFIDQDAVSLGFLICPLFFRNLDEESTSGDL